MDKFTPLTQKVNADPELKQRLVKELSGIQGGVGDLVDVFDSEEPDLDECELALTNLDQGKLQAVYDIFVDISK